MNHEHTRRADGGGYDEITLFGTFAIAVSLSFAVRHFSWIRTRAVKRRLA